MTHEELATEVKKIEPLILTFDNPTSGWWDGGSKKGGTFNFMLCWGGYEGKYNLPYHLEVGSWELNYFFKMAVPKNISQARSIAKRMLQKNVRVPCEIA